MKKIDHHDEAAQHGFTPPIPRRFLEDIRLAVGPKVLMVCMTLYQNMRDGVRPSQETLAKQLGVGLRTINRWVNQLASLGYVKVKKRATKKGQTNEYELSWKPCRDAEAHATDGVPDAIVTEPTDTAGVSPYVTDGVVEEKTGENKKNNTGAAVGSGNGHGSDSQALPSAPTDESNPQQIGTQDSMPNRADPWPQGRVKNDLQADTFHRTMTRVHIPANLRDQYSAIYAALRQCFESQTEAEPEGAIQRSLGEVSQLVAAGHVDKRGPAGLIVTKAKAYAEVPDRDFKADDVRRQYEQSLVVLADEQLVKLRESIQRQTKRVEKSVAGVGQKYPELVVPEHDGMVLDLVLWFVLERHGLEVAKEMFPRAAKSWMFSGPQVRKVYREEYPDVDVSDLDKVMRRRLKECGINEGGEGD